MHDHDLTAAVARIAKVIPIRKLLPIPLYLAPKYYFLNKTNSLCCHLSSTAGS